MCLLDVNYNYTVDRYNHTALIFTFGFERIGPET
jgi:hypothetical protein